MGYNLPIPTMPTSLVLRSIRSNVASCRSFGFLFSGRSAVPMRFGLSPPTFVNNSVLKPTSAYVYNRFSGTFSKYRADAIAQFTGSKALHATHHDLQESQYSGRRPPTSGRPWIDGIPPSVIFWGILALNVGVFAAWWSAESSYVCFQFLVILCHYWFSYPVL